MSSVIPAIDVNQPGAETVASSGNGFVEGATLTAKVTDWTALQSRDRLTLRGGVQVGNTCWTNVGTGQPRFRYNDGGSNFRVLASYTDTAGHVEAPVSSIIPAVDVDRAGTLICPLPT